MSANALEEQKNTFNFRVGDTVDVHMKIVEGKKERVQVYSGTVIAIRGEGISETFTVSRIAFGYANEKIFPMQSPNLVKVAVVKRGDVRRAKLNYIRGKVGKSAKVKGMIGRIKEDMVAREAAVADKEETKDSETE